MYKLETILINSDENEIFFHVLGDAKKYYDLESMSAAHPELNLIIQSNKRELEREIFHRRELMDSFNSY